MFCPHCKMKCCRDEVSVGTVYGPFGCPGCGWSEDERYNLRERSPGPDARGGYIDQYGGYHPAGSPAALAIKLEEEPV